MWYKSATVRQKAKGLGKNETSEISKPKNVKVSENSNRAFLGILKRLPGTPRTKRFLLSKYKFTSIWYQRNEGI